MKKALTLLLAVCMLLALCVVPVSAEMSPTQSLADVKASGAEYLQLTHKNHKEYVLEASPYPGDLTETEYKVGSKVYSHDDVCFLNVAKGAEGENPQTPGHVIWDIEANKYQVFQCEWGKGAWSHGGGAAVSLSIVAIYQDQEITIATSPYVKQGDEPVRVAGLIPQGTTQIKAVCSSIDGSIASCSSIMGEAVVYAADASYAPEVSAASGQVVFTKNNVGGTVYKAVDVPDFTTDSTMTFCYDVKITADVPGLGGLNIDGFGHMRDFGWEDAEGNAVGGVYVGVPDQNGVGSHAVIDISDYAYDQWYTREFSLEYFNGTFTQLLFCADTHASDETLVSGAGTAYYKNICVKDADGNIVWSYAANDADITGATDYAVSPDADYTFTLESDGTFVSVPCSPLQYFQIADTEYIPATSAPATEEPKGTTGSTEGEGTKGNETEPTTEEKGCGGMIGAGALVLAAIAAAPIAFGKKH